MELGSVQDECQEGSLHETTLKTSTVGTRTSNSNETGEKTYNRSTECFSGTRIWRYLDLQWSYVPTGGIGPDLVIYLPDDSCVDQRWELRKCSDRVLVPTGTTTRSTPATCSCDVERMWTTTVHAVQTDKYLLREISDLDGETFWADSDIQWNLQFQMNDGRNQIEMKNRWGPGSGHDGEEQHLELDANRYLSDIRNREHGPTQWNTQTYLYIHYN